MGLADIIGSFSTLGSVRGSAVSIPAFLDTYVENWYGGAVAISYIPLRRAVIPTWFIGWEVMGVLCGCMLS